MTADAGRLQPELESWFESRGWSPFAFQREVWESYRAGGSGLVHAPTGLGKTLAVWLGPLDEWLREHEEDDRDSWEKADDEPIRVLWITPRRALAADTVEALRARVEDLGVPWRIERRTGVTSASVKARQRMKLPTCLVTTPESLSLILSQERAKNLLGTLRAVVVDEWHELLSSKRGSQTELALARLRSWSPGLRVWGMSATIANLDEAANALTGVNESDDVVTEEGSEGAAGPRVVVADDHKSVEIETIIPESMERFPWSGHIGTNLVPEVCKRIEQATSSLVFCNTRAQVEIWYEAIIKHRPDWLGRVSLHHGSLEKEIRDKVEQGLKDGRAKAVVCTSSLDLGVDFSPVEQVFQVGSPKGVARLLQRAGRSGHSPGAVSRVIGVPAHACELIEFAAARAAAERREVEPRTPLSKPLDVLVQHLVTVALGGGFEQAELYDEVRSAWSYRDLTRREFAWALDFVTQGGPALHAYPEFQRVQRVAPEMADVELTDEQRYLGETGGTRAEAARFTVGSERIARMHRMGIGTITSDAAMSVRYIAGGGRALGTVEESFVSKLRPGDCFVFAGRVLEFVRVREMTAYVKKTNKKKATVPRWGGGRSPLSTMLADEVRRQLELAAGGERTSPELAATSGLLDLQMAASLVPARTQLLIEYADSRDGHHAFIYPFQGRLVHEGLGALLAHRLAKIKPSTYDVTVNDYGIELLSPDPVRRDEADWRSALARGGLLEDLLACVNSGQLARRAFRDIARIAGLVHPGFPGARSKGARQLQASSEMFFDVFADFDPSNLLLDQAKREVLERQLEYQRLEAVLDKLGGKSIVTVDLDRLSPLAFPLYAERLRTQHVSSEKWSDRIRKLVASLEKASG